MSPRSQSYTQEIPNDGGGFALDSQWIQRLTEALQKAQGAQSGNETPQDGQGSGSEGNLPPFVLALMKAQKGSSKSQTSAEDAQKLLQALGKAEQHSSSSGGRSADSLSLPPVFVAELLEALSSSGQKPQRSENKGQDSVTALALEWVQNLERLKTILQETEALAQRMEHVLASASQPSS